MRADRKIFSILSAVALVAITAPVNVTLAEAHVQKHPRVQHHTGARQPVVRAVPPRGTGLAVAPLPTPYDPYGPAPLGAPVNGAPFGVSGCYGSRVQVYVQGQGLVWRPQVDCPYQDNP